LKIDRKDLRDWMFRGLLFEAEAERFRAAGIRVGVDESESERGLFEETLDPFGIELRNAALRMARLYALVYCFENSVRDLIAERLQELHGVDWWKLKVPKKIQEFAEARQKDAQENSWLEGESKDILGFVEFGHLSDIIVANWEDFSDLVPSQHWIKQRFDELEKARNFVAHNRFLLPGEFQRLEMYINDWNRMVGL
jgi:HEPN superfamily Swt1-like protein